MFCDHVSNFLDFTNACLHNSVMDRVFSNEFVINENDMEEDISKIQKVGDMITENVTKSKKD